ncbi:MAG: hypothetical protein ACYC8T_17780 [Myxococcaceae bacterium]
MLAHREKDPNIIEYTIPGGCLGCGADLPVRVTPNGAVGVCRSCGLFSRPTLTVTHQGLEVTLHPNAQA